MEIFTGKNIVKRYTQSNFNLKVPELILPAESITGVVGENGNGKTTLLNIVAGELKSEGSLTYFGASPRNWSQVKNKIGFIPQRIPRWYGTLEQNLYLKGALEGHDAKELDEKLDSLLDFLDLQKYRKLKWTEISTGYRLRFELARVLLGNPELLVLDEPLANLDINTQQKFLSDLRELLSNRGKPMAVLLSSQQLHEIESVATQMLFLKQGQSIFSGGVEEISEVSEKRLYEIQLTSGSMEELKSSFSDDTEITSTGPYLQLNTTMTSKELMQHLISKDLDVKYYRDLTNSTKRFFN